MEEGDGHETYPVPTNFTKVFMQLMCPSCCGGLFSETKGSVYMKRPSVRPSTSRSVLTTTSNESELILDDDIDERNTPGERKHTLSTIQEVRNEKGSPPNTPKSMKNLKTTDSPEQKPREIRSVSLGDALCQELSQNISSNGEINWNNKLRKTSYPSNDTDVNKQRRDTIIELKIRGKEHVEVVKQNSSDDPPFNFQAILRKTNNTRQSLKLANSVTEKKKGKSDNYFVVELLPGIILEGITYDL